MKELKIPVSCRILPDLKEELEIEAQEAGQTTSLYLEQILQNRHAPAEVDGEAEAEIEELQAEVKSLQSASERMKAQIGDLRKVGNRSFEQLERANEEKAKLQTTISMLEKEAEPIRKLGIIGLSPLDVVEVEGYLAAIGAKHPGLSRVHILLAALNRTVKNENSMFVIHTVDGYSQS